MDNSILPDITLLRNNIDFASIAQFFHTFYTAFHPWPMTANDIIYARQIDSNEYVFETEDLERMILDPVERIRLEDLMVRMLRFSTKNRFINVSTWQTCFSKEFDKKQQEGMNPFVGQDQTIDYFDMALDVRVHLLYLLCEWQLDEPEKLREHLVSEDDAVQWRVDPIGYDRKGSIFWLFDDNRLYKETPEPEKIQKPATIIKRRPTGTRSSSRRSKTIESEEDDNNDNEEWTPWKLICLTKFDWENIATKYANSKHIDEQRFHRFLVNDLVPKVLPALEEREKERKKQEAMIHRKRSSRLMVRELEYYDLGPRTSSRLEKKQEDKEKQEKEQLAKARKERLLERERRLMEREYRAMTREKRQEEEESVETMIEPTPKKEETKEGKKPKRKYTKRLDEHGNPLPRKPKLGVDGNPIPLKKRGRKPKNKNVEEDNWLFECVCGISGQNLDDGSSMIACEQCGIWQHIACLEKSGQIEQKKKLDDILFVCQKCKQNEHNKKQKIEHIGIAPFQGYQPIAPQHVPLPISSHTVPSYLSNQNNDVTHAAAQHDQSGLPPHL